MFITGECRKCQRRAVFDVGNTPKKDVDAWLAKTDFGECQAGGWHVELGKMADYYNMDWIHTFGTAEEAKRFISDLASYKRAREVG